MRLLPPLLSLLWFAAVVGAVSCGGNVDSDQAGPSSRYVFRVDRELASVPPTVKGPGDTIPDESYRPREPHDRYEVTLTGDRVTISPLDARADTSRSRIEGSLAPSPAPGEKRFRLDSAFAGGAFIIRGERAELTLYGSGVPIVSSERGDLLAR